MIPNTSALVLLLAFTGLVTVSGYHHHYHHHPHHSRTFKSRIVNGTEAEPGKYPSLVSLQSSSGSHTCGATILNRHWVLTAAHCVHFDDPSALQILSGTNTLDDGGTTHEVVKVIPHEGFHLMTTKNDIAVIKVYPPFKFDHMTQPVSLPHQNEFMSSGSPATIVGWGLPYTGGRVSNYLQEVEYYVVSDKDCQRAHKKNTIFSTNICGYYPGGHKGQCSGDSGGPLFVNGHQAGIVSWSIKPCSVPPYPGVFTEVSAYVDWINSKIRY